MLKPAKNNAQRCYSYKENLVRYKKAMKAGFYFEALLIDYALIEDRLRSYLYYLGVFEKRDDDSACGYARKQLNGMQRDYLGMKSPGLYVTKITGKMDVIRATLLWFQAHPESPEDNKYQAALWKQYHDRMDIDDLLDALDDLDRWRKERNDIVHGLLGKDVLSLTEGVEQLCIEGHVIFRRIDAAVRKVSHGTSCAYLCG